MKPFVASETTETKNESGSLEDLTTLTHAACAGHVPDEYLFTVLSSDEMGVDSTRFQDQAETSG